MFSQSSLKSCLVCKAPHQLIWEVQNVQEVKMVAGSGSLEVLEVLEGVGSSECLQGSRVI